MNEQLPISYEEMRGLVVEVLTTFASGQTGTLELAVAELAAKRNISATANTPAPSWAPSRSSHLSRKDTARVQSILWDLLVEGIVRPGLNDGTNNNLPFFHVTDFGREKLKGVNATPYDPDGYLKRLQKDCPTLDPIILVYLTESLHTFRIGCLLSSIIALGCASEKALLLLVASYADALPESRQQKFRQNTENRLIKRQFDEFAKMLDSHLRALLPGDLADDLDVALNAVFTMFRNHRNAAGHPTGNPVTREQAHANLIVFPVYVKKVYGLMGWLKANTPLT